MLLPQLTTHLQNPAPAEADIRQLYRQIAAASAAGQTCTEINAATTRNLLPEVAHTECPWALLLANLLWRNGRQTFADFENHRQFAQFACNSKFTRLPIEQHLALAQTLIEETPSPALYILLGNARRFLHQYASAEDAYLEGIHRYPDDPFLKLRLADLYLATYQIESAHCLLRQLQPAYPYAREMLFIAPANQQAQIPAAVFPALSCGKADMVWLVAADPAYLEKYAEPWINSVRRMADERIHLHVIADKGSELPDPLRQRLQCAVPLTLTERTVELGQASPNQRKALFSSERFLFLAEMLQKYQVPMVVTDIDVECVRDPCELLSRIGEADLGYTHFRNTIEAWERYAATALIFRPTEAAISFCRRMADLLVSALDSHAQPWFIDQIALFRLIEEFPLGVRTCFLEHILTESNPPAPSGYFRILHGSWQGEG